MSKRTIEYSCLLISPSDVNEERAAIVDVINHWNAQIGKNHDASVRLVMWETHAVPDVSAPAQEVLNRDIVDECDFGIAVFWTRLGSPTTTYDSGSMEEIERLRQRGARVLVYMGSAPIPQERLKDDQYHRLSEFKKQLRNEGLLGTYHDVADLREQILLHTTTVVIHLLQKIGVSRLLMLQRRPASSRHQSQTFELLFLPPKRFRQRLAYDTYWASAFRIIRPSPSICQGFRFS